MTDIIDKANRKAQQNLDAALQKAALPKANAITECVDCGEPIGAKRKQAVPWAVRCVHCQAVLELQRSK